MKPKVFGIGLHRTGTSSLTRALQILGWRTVHWPLSEQEIDLAEAATDSTVACRFEELDARFPDSKFILTIRDVQTWMDSMYGYFTPDHFTAWRPRNWTPTQLAFADQASVQLFGQATVCVGKEPEKLMADYYRHLGRVLHHFHLSGKARGKLLLLNICAGEKWLPLCKFLDVPRPKEDFPWWNPRGGKR